MAVVFISCLKKLHGNYYGKDGSMMEEHSVNLLRECDSGCKMAAESLGQIRDMCRIRNSGKISRKAMKSIRSWMQRSKRP